jgi:hypothetical protein
VPPDKQEEIEEKINILTDKINVLVDQAEQAGCKVIKLTYSQCCGSESVGSMCFWASRIRIHDLEIRFRIRIRILLSSSKK